MKIHALIFAGGVGRRMNANGTPKQFLSVYGKPIIIHTLNHFQKHQKVDDIVLVCVESHLDYMLELAEEHKITKIIKVTAGGNTGQESISIGLETLQKLGAAHDDIVLIHDGVRPLITSQLITENIQTVKKFGTAISATLATETFCLVDPKDSSVETILPRERCMLAKAPQSFRFGDIYAAHQWAKDNIVTDAIDSADLMKRFGKELHFVPCSSKNIKITRPIDFYILKGIMDANESMQIIGI